MLTDRDIAIYSVGKTEGINSIAETRGKGLDDEKQIESWNKIMNLFGIKMTLKDLERIYNEFAKKMETVVNTNEAKQVKANSDQMFKDLLN